MNPTGTRSEPTCCERSGAGRWECHCVVRWATDCGKYGTELPRNRTARVLIFPFQRRLVALHGFIKKTRTTPADDLALARKRQKELEK